MKKIILSVLAVLVTACATIPYQPYAREVKKKPQEGGVIALHSDPRPEDRQRADSMMATNCGPNATVKITEEGEVVVGEKTHSNSDKTNETRRDSVFRVGGIGFGSGMDRPAENTATTTETSQLKEWQIGYTCVAVAAPGKRVVGHK